MARSASIVKDDYMYGDKKLIETNVLKYNDFDNILKNKDPMIIFKDEHIIRLIRILLLNIDGNLNIYDFKNEMEYDMFPEEGFKDVFENEIYYEDEHQILFRFIVDKNKLLEYTRKYNLKAYNNDVLDEIDEKEMPEILLYINKDIINDININMRHFLLVRLLNIETVRKVRKIIDIRTKKKLKNKYNYTLNTLHTKYPICNLSFLIIDGSKKYDYSDENNVIKTTSDGFNKLILDNTKIKSDKIGNYKLYNSIKTYNISHIPINIKTKPFDDCSLKEFFVKILLIHFYKGSTKDTYIFSKYLFNKIIREYDNKYKEFLKKNLYARQGLLTLAAACNNFSILDQDKYRWIFDETPKFHLFCYIICERINLTNKRKAGYQNFIAMYDPRIIGRTFIETKTFLNFLNDEECVLPTRFRGVKDIIGTIGNKNTIIKHPSMLFECFYDVAKSFNNDFELVKNDKKYHKKLYKQIQCIQDKIVPTLKEINFKIKNNIRADYIIVNKQRVYLTRIRFKGNSKYSISNFIQFIEFLCRENIITGIRRRNNVINMCFQIKFNYL